LAAVPRLREEDESVKVTVFPDTEMASNGPDVAKVNDGPLIVAPCAVIVVVAVVAGVDVIKLFPCESKSVATVRFVPVALVKLIFVEVTEVNVGVEVTLIVPVEVMRRLGPSWNDEEVMPAMAMVAPLVDVTYLLPA